MPADTNDSAREARAALDQRRQQILSQLEEAATAKRQAEETIEQLVSEYRQLRLGTWKDIADAVGAPSGQAAYQRYGKRLPDR